MFEGVVEMGCRDVVMSVREAGIGRAGWTEMGYVAASEPALLVTLTFSQNRSEWFRRLRTKEINPRKLDL